MSQGSDPFEFIKNFWANVPGMPSGGAGPGMPSFDPADLEKRVGELKQVKQWLEMNLNMLNMQINTLEMQLTAVNSFENYTSKSASAPHEAPKRPQYSYQPPEPSVEDNEEEEEGAPPDMSQANAAAKAASDAGADAIAQGAQAMQSMPWANPGEWIKSMQAAFAGSAPVKKPAKGKAKTKTPARRAAPKKSPASTAAPSPAKRAPAGAAKSKRPRKAP
jgi:hypothetical protein